MTKVDTREDVAAWQRAAVAEATAAAWHRLGLFERLRSGPVARADLGLEPRALAVTVPILIHVGLIVADGDALKLSPAGARLLQEGALPTERTLEMLRDLSRLPDVLREGGPVKDDQGRSRATRGGTRVDRPEETERFLEGLYLLSAEASKLTFEHLAPDLPAGGTVLDLGGGHGRYARAFADAGFEVTLFDQPEVVQLAKKRHGAALRYLEGDFHEVEGFGGPYDLVLLCNIVHGETDEANASLVQRAARSLRPGGRLAIRDNFMDDENDGPARAVFFGMTMLLYTEGQSPTLAQVERWFEAAGLTGARVDVVGAQRVAVAHRP